MKQKIIFILIFFILSLVGIVFAWQSASYDFENIKDENQSKSINEIEVENIIEKKILENINTGISQDSKEEDESALIESRKEKREAERKLLIEKYVDKLVRTGNILFRLKKSETLFLLKIVVEGQNQPAIIKVPEDYKSIQTAIENAKEGDIVVVVPGEYQENIVMREGVSLRGTGEVNLIPTSSLISLCSENKDIIESAEIAEEDIADSSLENLDFKDCNKEENLSEKESSSENLFTEKENFDVILNGNGIGNVVTFKNGISDKTSLSGFIIKNSGKNLSGILIEDSSPWIHDNILTDNEFNIYIKGNSAPVIQKNALQFASKGIQVYNFQKEEKLYDEDNKQVSSTQEYGANSIFLTKPNILDNLITDNKIGIDLYNSSALINHNTISYNNHYKAYLGATFGIYTINSSAEITNNIISDNGICELCAGINVDAKSKDILISYNNIWNNKNNFVCYGQCNMQDNNFSEDSQFANSIDGNYFLKSDSGLIGKSEDKLDIGVRW
ncbi:MAG: hypothetical protein KAS01_00495 [Candidatus Pacebacteria bacterium]|nr:hypothetical protein [Candidatus Paceibacterota bacterium]